MNNINIKISEVMGQNNDDYEEDFYIRIPKELRTTMGLDVGQDIVINSVNNKQIVLIVNPAYKLDVITDANHCYVSNKIFNLINIANKCSVEKINKITLGCDPEFFLTDNKTKHLLRANAFFKKWGEVGNDGILGELRPKPSLTAKGLTDNLYELIKQTRQILNLDQNNYDPSRIMLHAASSYKTGLHNQLTTGTDIYATAGFHLHFGLPNKLLNTTPKVMSVMFKIARVMDYYVGIPAILAEQSKDYKRRNNTCVSYGKPGDFRLDNRTFEYRVPGGSLLRHPALTYGLINLGNFVITDIINKLAVETDNFNNLDIAYVNKVMGGLYPEIPSLNTLFDVMCSPELTTANTLMDSIHNNLRNMIEFGKSSEDIEFFLQLIKNTNYINNNIEANWRSNYESQPYVCRSSHA